MGIGKTTGSIFLNEGSPKFQLASLLVAPADAWGLDTMKHIEHGMADHGEIGRSMAFSDPTLVFAKAHIQYPMNTYCRRFSIS